MVSFVLLFRSQDFETARERRLTFCVIAEDDLDIVVQPGVGYEALNAELKERGIPLMFPVDPAPGASESTSHSLMRRS